MISHGNLAHNLQCIIKGLKADESTVVVSWLPQYHDMGLIGSYLGILVLRRQWLLSLTCVICAQALTMDSSHVEI